MNNDDLDPTDETLSRGLSALAPSEFELDADAALGSMRPAFQRARSRRRLAMTSSALGVVAVLAAGAVVLQQQPASHVDIRSRTQPTVSTPTKTPTTRVSTSTTQPRVVTPPSTPHTSASTVPGNGNGNGGTVPHSTPTSPDSTPTTPDDHGGSTPTTTAAPSTKTYTSVGGRATIRFANGRLTLVSHAPTAGYTEEIHTNKPDDIELRFTTGDGRESRIRVRVQDGHVEPEITEK
jgi:hypothetical protein